MSSYRTIMMKGDPNGADRIEDEICDAAIRPGSHVYYKGNSSGGSNATVAASTNRLHPTTSAFILESPQLPRNRGTDHNSTLSSIEGTYAAKDHVPVWFPQPGDVVLALANGKGTSGNNLLGAGTYSVGDPLIPGGSGALFNPETGGATAPVAIAYENKEITTQGAIGRLKVLVV